MKRTRGKAKRTKKPARRPAARRTARTAPAARVLLAADLMTRNPIVVLESLTVGQLCDLLQEKNINGAPVVDGRGRLVGVVTQEDIIYGAMGHAGAGEGAASTRPGRRMMAILRGRDLATVPQAPPRPGEKPFWTPAGRPPDPMNTPVGNIMTSPAISAEEQTPVSDLCRIMWSLRIHRVPILRGGKVTGLISSMDLCRAILEGKIRI